MKFVSEDEIYIRIESVLPLSSVTMPIRLIGVSLSSLEPPPLVLTKDVAQQSLLDTFLANITSITTCPCCNCSLDGFSNQKVNSHMDSCLNSTVVGTLLQDDKSLVDPSSPPPQKKHLIHDYFCNNNRE